MPKLTGKLVRNNVTDTYALLEDLLMQGGFKVVVDQTERDALPSSVRKDGMLVYNQADTNFYQLQGGVSNGDWALWNSGPQDLQSVLDAGNSATKTVNLTGWLNIIGSGLYINNGGNIYVQEGGRIRTDESGLGLQFLTLSSGSSFAVNGRGKTNFQQVDGNVEPIIFKYVSPSEAPTGNKVMMALYPNDQVEIYHDGVKVLETNSGGIEVFGSITANNVFSGNPSDINQDGATDGQVLKWNNSASEWQPMDETVTVGPQKQVKTSNYTVVAGDFRMQPSELAVGNNNVTLDIPVLSPLPTDGSRLEINLYHSGGSITLDCSNIDLIDSDAVAVSPKDDIDVKSAVIIYDSALDLFKIIGKYTAQ